MPLCELRDFPAFTALNRQNPESNRRILNRRTEEQRNRGTEEQRNRGTEEQRNRETEEQRNRGTEKHNRGTEERRNRGTDERIKDFSGKNPLICSLYSNSHLFCLSVLPFICSLCSSPSHSISQSLLLSLSTIYTQLPNTQPKRPLLSVTNHKPDLQNRI
jgi:hypothetical protein